MTRTSPMTTAWIWTLIGCAGLALPACGGGEKAPKTAASEDTSTPSAAAASAEASSPSTEPGSSEDAWEGEAEATGKAPGATSASKSGETTPAPADTKGEETRTTEAIANVIKTNRKPFRDCFDKGTKDLPDLEGTMTLHFVLDPEGNVKLAELNQPRSDVKAKVIVDCAIAVLKGMKFPPSSRGMESTVNHPFDFKRKQQNPLTSGGNSGAR